MALADRVRLLVDRHWGGSVNAAAEALEVPQQTLQRIVTGKTPNPRMAVVVQIAEGFRVSSDWLISGRGTEPPEINEAGRAITGALIRLRNVLDKIGAAPTLRRSFEDLAASQFTVAVHLHARLKPKKGGATLGPTIQAGLNAMTATEGAWADVLEAAVEEYGPTRVHLAFIKDAPLIALGSTRFADRLWLSPRQPQLAKVYAAMARDYEASETSDEGLGLGTKLKRG